MSDTISCCPICICENPHKSTPVPVEQDPYASDSRYISETPSNCCDLCTCTVPHRSKPLD